MDDKQFVAGVLLSTLKAIQEKLKEVYPLIPAELPEIGPDFEELVMAVLGFGETVTETVDMKGISEQDVFIEFARRRSKQVIV